jgi:hypothetical protein
MDKIIITNHQDIQKEYPFLTCIVWKETEMIGIVQNADDKMLSFYDLNAVRDYNEKKLFLEFGDSWWNESNRLLPINIFMQGAMSRFRPALQTFKLKETEIVFGPVTSLNNLLTKRIKRSQIQLVVKKA